MAMWKTPTKTRVPKCATKNWRQNSLKPIHQVLRYLMQHSSHQFICCIRNRGLSAKEIVTCRDQMTGEQLNINDSVLSQQQSQLWKTTNKVPNLKLLTPHWYRLIHLSLPDHLCTSSLREINLRRVICKLLTLRENMRWAYSCPGNTLFHSTGLMQ